MMNNSGEAVLSLAQFYKVEPEQICIVADDIDREFGSIRSRFSGGDGGHNGLKSIIAHFGTEFTRVRVSVANHHRTSQNASEFVLGRFLPEEQKVLKSILEVAAQKCEDFIDDTFSEETIQVL